MYVSREALRDKFTTEVSTAWRRLFDFLLQHIQIGYLKAVEKAEGKSTSDED
jgi:hypothetical protein